MSDDLLCRLGWHRLRWFRQPDGTWEPRCSRCQRLAAWWVLEQGTHTAPDAATSRDRETDRKAEG